PARQRLDLLRQPTSPTTVHAVITTERPVAVPTVLTAWTGTLPRALHARRPHRPGPARAAGLDAAGPDAPDHPGPPRARTPLGHPGIATPGDPTFGIEVSRYVRATTFHALGPAFLASATLRSALERTARYGRVCADVTLGSAAAIGDEFALSMEWQPSSAQPC